MLTIYRAGLEFSRAYKTMTGCLLRHLKLFFAINPILILPSLVEIFQELVSYLKGVEIFLTHILKNQRVLKFSKGCIKNSFIWE